MRRPTSSPPKPPVCAGWRRQRRTADRRVPTVLAVRRREIQLERIETCAVDVAGRRDVRARPRRDAPFGRADVRRAGERLHRSASARQHTDGRLGGLLRHASRRALSPASHRPGIDARRRPAAIRAPVRPHPTRSPDRRNRPPASTATSGAATSSPTRHGNTWVIDPAAHGGHRETDLAMMRLFGGFGERCYAAYDEASPARAGTRGPGRCCISSIRCSCTPCCSAAGTAPTPSRAARRYAG